MTISAAVIADSISDTRITTLQLRYPRFIHAEFMTHRVFSRNASSSRAIPVQRLIQDVIDDPAMPVHWGKNQPGMQAREEHDAPVKFRNDQVSPEIAWMRARDVAIDAAQRFNDAGYHKQVANRLLEPFSHINVLVTATDWDNFFALRDHEDAQPEIQLLARAMREAMDLSTPTPLHVGDWHLPYVETALYSGQPRAAVEDAKLISSGRCARVSYLTHDGKKSTPKSDMQLSWSLIDNRHASPFEHQATPAYGRHANFNGWISQRAILGL